MPITRRNILLSAAATLAAPAMVRAQEALPETMRLILPFPPGNSLDASARAFAEAYRTASGRNCFVENKPGAAATIAANEVSRAKPDGSVLLWTTGGHLTTAVLMKKIPYDPIDGFTPVTPVYQTDGFVLATRAGSPFNSVKDVIDAARRSPGRVSYASAGIGNTTHVVGALFARSAGVDMLHVPYRGDFLTDLIAGVTDMMFVSPGVIDPLVKGGKLKLLGITGAKRSDRYPDLPAFSESGLKDIDVPAYSILLAPPKMPPATLAALYEGTVKALHSPVVATAFTTVGNRVWSMPPQDFKLFLQKELKDLQRILPPLGIQMDA
ncbi:MAG: tripartite tricarboxylate transporter substrate binding protein [Pseudomonadota bacterium]